MTGAIPFTLILDAEASFTLAGNDQVDPAIIAVIGPRGPFTGERPLVITTSGSLTPNFDVYDFYDIRALASDIDINDVVGTLTDGSRIMFRILDDGVSRTLYWNASFQDGGVGLTIQTTPGKLTHLGFMYHEGRSTWYSIARTVEP